MSIRPLITDPQGQARYMDREQRAMPAGQEWRELVVNGAEAGASRIVIDGWPDPDTGRQLLRVSDNGKGMNDTQLVKHLETMHVTTSGKGPENHGVGARLATLPANPAGVTYASRTADGFEGMVQMVRERGAYGLRQWQVEVDGYLQVVDVVATDEGELSRVPGSHGTAVILHGDGKHATWAGASPYAVHKYLATRFYRFPGDVRVVAQQAVGPDQRGQLHTVVPLDSWLAKYAVARDSMPFQVKGGTGTIAWALLPEKAPNQAGRDATTGGVGLMNQAEIFNYGLARSPDFGLIYRPVSRRVVVLVDIDGASMDEARGGLVLPGRKPVPWREIGQHFADHMPPEIERLLAKVDVSAGVLDERMAALLDKDWADKLTPVMAAVPSPEGTPSAGSEQGASSPPTTRDDDDDDNDGETKPRRPRKPRARTHGGDDPATLRPRVVTPSVVFLAPDEMADGHDHITYIEAANQVQISTEFPPYVREVGRWMESTEHTESVVRRAVELAYRVEFAATIVDANAQANHGIAAVLIEELKSDAALYTKALGFQSLSERVRAFLKDAARLAA